jgi:hypothetical protein
MVNQRIKSFAEQVGFTTHPSTDVIKNNHFGGYMDGNQFDEFAKLVVLECIRYFNEDYQRDFDVLWRQDLSDGIKAHFGIE